MYKPTNETNFNLLQVILIWEILIVSSISLYCLQSSFLFISDFGKFSSKMFSEMSSVETFRWCLIFFQICGFYPVIIPCTTDNKSKHENILKFWSAIIAAMILSLM